MSRRRNKAWLDPEREPDEYVKLDDTARAALISMLRLLRLESSFERANAAENVERLRSILGLQWEDLIVAPHHEGADDGPTDQEAAQDNLCIREEVNSDDDDWA